MARLKEVIQIAKGILEKNKELVSRGGLQAEAEQIVTAAYQRVAGGFLKRMDLFNRREEELSSDTSRRVVEMAEKRAQGGLLQYITGFQTFLNNDYLVGPGVLVPRPETELLVTTAIQEIKKRVDEPSLGFEIGLGCGAISIELLQAFPNLEMQASEAADSARIWALKNAERILQENVQRLTVQSARSMDVLDAFQGTADFIISNPPYLTSSDDIEAEVTAHEPSLALFSPQEDEIYFYRKIANHASQYLRPQGMIFLEIPSHRAEKISSCFKAMGWRNEISLDLSRRARILMARLEDQ